ncbi:MAG: hypothetical protein HUU27_03985, partial [Phycisphaerae bacterium]|nr:hypothetical protein [Phycisphaerae bacterium]
LQAALRLAGPLHRVMTDDLSGWDLLRRLGKRVCNRALALVRRRRPGA